MWRKVAAASLVLAPVALAVSTGIDPALGEDQGYGVYRAHPEATQWHSLLLHWAWVLCVPGFLGLLALVRRRGAILAGIAWVATVLGLVTFSALMAADFGLLSLEQQPGLTDAQLTAYDDRIGAMPWAVWGWQIPGIAGWAVALIVTPLAAVRAGVINWWTAGLALLGTALYLLFAISPVPLSLTGPVVLVVAYAMAARQMLRFTSDGPDVFGAFRHHAGRICLVAAPLSFAVGMATVPLPQASAFFLHLAWVLFIPAVLTVAARGGRFTRVVSGLAVLGLIHFSALMFGDYLDLAARQALGDAVADRAADLTGGYVTFTLGWVLPGMVLTFLGLILVAVGAAVDRLVRWWAPALVVAGFAGFFLLGLGPIGVVGPLVLVAGFGSMAVALGTPTPTRGEPVAVSS
ncbi:hypothetical protein M1L60_33075 [Actinoplanes sp. TRM 88003]|uniref:Uncharacterized protein n=1 Tax=Paractinoplanes aksuensis TaxID=2939490 RepID=A0ABT1E0P5_9ACTN|nr:hypothetical protein [Actinoplanes aksuensis]MCO8275426.1 hypothetical protein [Actinoplanes aksuensis]